MKKYIVLLTLAVLAFMIVPLSASAQSASYYQQKLYQIDSQIQGILAQRKKNSTAQRDIETWTSQAGVWMNEHDQVNAALWAARERKGAFGTMNQQQLNEAVKSLQEDFARLSNPPGGRVVGDRRYYNLMNVYDDMGKRGNDLERLQLEHHELTQKLFAWDSERDKVASEWKYKSGKQIPNNTELINTLKDERQDKIRQINDENLWCDRHLEISKEELGFSPVVCRERRSVMVGLAIQHKADAIRKGEEPDPKVLVTLVKQAQNRSNVTKKEMQQHDLKALNQAIESLEARDLQTQMNTSAPPAAPPEVELRGCWKIFDPDGGKPARVSISKNNYGEYAAKITDYAWINHPNGHVLFRVARINGTSFEGTEYSQYNNKPTQTHLRVIVDNDGRGATYRTRDDTLSLVPCY